MGILSAGVYSLITQHPVISGLIAVGVILYVAAPAVFAKGKAAAVTWLEATIKKHVGLAVNIPGNDELESGGGETEKSPAMFSDADEIVRSRMAEYEAACPKSSAEQRLFWAGKGLSVDLARVAYINDLESLQSPLKP